MTRPPNAPPARPHWEAGRVDRARMDAALDKAELRKELELARRQVVRLEEQSHQLRSAGGLLATCAFNLAQRREALTDADKQTLDERRRNWDDLVANQQAPR